MPSLTNQSKPTKGQKAERATVTRKRTPRPHWAPGSEIGTRDPSPLHGKAKQTRINRMLALLEAAASEGDVGAAKYRLDFHRWEQEMKHGRPGSRGGEEAPAVAIIIANGAGTIAGGDAETVRLLRQLRQGKPAGALTDRSTRPTDDDDGPAQM